MPPNSKIVSHGEGKTKSQGDVRMIYLKETIQATFLLSEKAYDRFFDSDDFRQMAVNFFEQKDNKVLFVYKPTHASLEMVTSPPKASKSMILYFMKSHPVKITTYNIKETLTIGQVALQAMETLSLIANEIYLPIVKTPYNVQDLTDQMSREVDDTFNSLLADIYVNQGHTEGKTRLPLPMNDIGDDQNKDRIHQLETVVITWTNQIKEVLKKDPENMFKDGSPGPLDELEFWENKSSDLESISEQLDFPKVKRVIEVLEKNDSQYIPQFLKLLKEVDSSKVEAKSNYKYLSPMKPYFEQLHYDSPNAVEFTELKEVFSKIYHLIYLVWNRSAYYNTSTRLIVLIRELANDVIAYGRQFADSSEVLNIDPSEALSKLGTVLAVCGSFKKYYFAYKSKIATENESKKHWKIPSHALFHNLDQFMERCNDIKELINLVLLFNSLNDIEIGGTKGQILTNEIGNVYGKFKLSYETFRNAKYDFLDITKREFEDHYYDFKKTIKELETMLGSILTKGFEDCPHVNSSFKLIESFQGLLEREIIQQDLEKNNENLLTDLRTELQQVQEHFQKYKDDPPLFVNQPPTSGSLIWSQGLIDRIDAPLNHIQGLNEDFLDSVEGEEVVKLHQSLKQTIQDYQVHIYETWGEGLADMGKEKLQLPLLTRDSENKSLCNNFDPHLTRLLREVNNMEKLNSNRADPLSIPQEAMSIYEQVEVYRTQSGQLAIIVNTYNKMHSMLLDVEGPLLQSRLDKIDQVLEKGINELTWQSEGIDAFIEEVNGLVKETSRVLFTLKINVQEIEQLLKKWKKHSLFERRESRTLTLDDFNGRYREIKSQREKFIRDGGKLIHEKVQSSFDTLKTIEKSNPAWIKYVNHINSIVTRGIVQAVLVCLEDLTNQLDEQILSKNEMNPLLEITLRIDYNQTPFEAVFNPKLHGEGSLDSIVNQWIDDFTETATYISRLDNEAENYLVNVKENEKILEFVKKVHNLLNVNAGKCILFKKNFSNFEFLWSEDKETSFEKFIEENEDVVKNQDYSELFEERITKYEKIEDELTTLPNSGSVGWLRIDSRPLKNELKQLCVQWKSTFTGHLVKEVENVLSDIYSFMDTVNEGLDKEVKPGDVETLKKVISHIREVKKRVEEGTKNGIFQPLQNIAMLLKNHNCPLQEKILEKLENAPKLWNELHQKALNVREKLSPLQDQEASKLKQQVVEFNSRVNDFRSQFLENDAFHWSSGVRKAYAALDCWHKKLVAIEKDAANSKHLQELFELTVVQYKELDECREELELLKFLWDMATHILSLFKHWMKSTFMGVDVDFLVDETKKLRKQVNSFSIKARGWNCFKGVHKEVENMITSLPLIQELRSPAMRERHWKELLSETGVVADIRPDDENFSVAELLSLGLHDHVDEVRSIVAKATKEIQIESALTKIESTWKKLVFTFIEDEELSCFILGPVDEHIEELEDNQVKLQNIASIRNVDYFIERVSRWQATLGTVDSNITLWKEVQQTWQNLYPIFILSEDIKEQLPEDSKRFENVDKQWRVMMASAKDIPNAIECVTTNAVQKAMEQSGEQFEAAADFNNLLQRMQENLEKCEKSLADYLETKRLAFPRFYFVAPQDLIDILSRGTNPKQIMNHMSKLVDAVKTLTFEESNPESENITSLGLISKENEELSWSSPFECSGQVEAWLQRVLDNIKDTLHNVIGEAHAAYIEQSREQWLFNFPAQVVIVTSRMWFTSEVNLAFERIEEGNKNAMRDYHKQQVSQIAKITQLVQGNLSSEDRKKIITLITVDTHNRDVVQKLIEEGADNSGVFSWQSQLRYSWDDNTGCVINIADATFNYNYEYVGNCGCLVITPLTDRCYITLTQSLRLMMGGAPAGPAGTGKTETTKDLGRALGCCVYVFNCTEQMDYLSLGNIFKGLSMTGTWGCFDEFNRVRVSVLSVVATQFKSILDAIRADVKEFEFQHEIIPLKKTVGVFITMNPGYKGRTELPENLKALFRPCAMVVPDFENICEIMLASEGFIHSKMLAKKFVTLYKLNNELLSKQDHYDWGLRAIKSVLVIAGGLKREEPTVSEELILLRALRDTNLAKLTNDDISIFLRLIGDLFPNMTIEPKNQSVLMDSTRKAIQHLNLQPAENEMFLKKVIQFKELLDVRHSVFILGPSGSGKSCVWKCLSEANRSQGKNTWTHIMNPKAVSSFELYGYMHEQTRDWKDGLLSNIMRQMSRANNEKAKWIILDGDIDSEWIESMNTVMDDNKVLTLANNERIQFVPSMRMIFEINQLKNATPATVSRAGILFLNSSDVGWAPFKESWIEKRIDDREKQTLERLFDKYTIPTFEFLSNQRRELKPIVPIREINMIQTLCYLLEGVLVEENCPPGSSQDVYEHYFVFACIWAFGSGFESEEKIIFNNWWKKRFTAVKFPDGATIFDFYVDHDFENGQIKMSSWSNLVQPYEHDPDLRFSEILVDTAETTKMRYMMNLLVPNQKPVLFIGTAGTGKTTIVKQRLHSDLSDDFVSATINMNSRTDSSSLQLIMEQYLERKSGKRFGPPGRKKLIYFIDDLNMPSLDKYGTQSAIALLRQQIDYGFWYNRAKMTLKEVTNVQYLAAMNPMAGSFTVNERLQRHFAVFACAFPSSVDLDTIYGQILNGHLSSQPFVDSVVAMKDSLVKAAITLHRTVQKDFLPTAEQFHYQFNLRELSNLFQGLCLSNSQFIQSRFDILKLFIHEVRRVYADRMSIDDIQRFEEKALKPHINQLVTEEELTKLTEKPITFVPFMNVDATGDKVYNLVSDYSELKKHIVDRLEDYNSEFPVMNLEMFQQAIDHVCRITRVISNPRGNALLVGFGGSGKQSLARLASHVCEYQIYQVVVSANYNMLDFKDSLINLYKRTGLKEQSYSFIVNDSQVVHDTMLVYLNDLLSSGDIPDLFPEDMKEDIISRMAREMKTTRPDLDTNSKQSCWGYFIEKVRSNLHVILCFSPMGRQFRKWCRKFPAIINCTVVDWFHDWPADALVSVAARFLNDIEVGDEDTKVQISQHMAFVHQTVNEACDKFRSIDQRYNYTTPKSYLEFISLYKSLLTKKREDLEDKMQRLNNGLFKLEDSASKINDLKAVLNDEKVIVAEKSVNTEEMVKAVEKERLIVEKEADAAAIEEKKTEELAQQAEKFERECQEDLDKAEPIVQAALAALDTLNKKAIQELKSFPKPKREVSRVTEAVLILINDPRKPLPKKFTWNDAKKMMSNPQTFIDLLKGYDKDNIPDDKMSALEPYVSDESFDPEAVKKISTAAAGLCSWVLSIVKYYHIYCEVEPKRQLLQEAQSKLSLSKINLKKVKDKVQALKNKYTTLVKEYNSVLDDKRQNEDNAKNTELKLELAGRLVNGLKDEKIRWKEGILACEERKGKLIGDVLIASAFISYVGAFTKNYRENLKEEWISDIGKRKISMTENLEVLYDVLTDDAQVALWNNEGLPSDIVSIENGAILTHSHRWPLMIDPQLQGIKWIKMKEEEHGLRTVQLNQKNYLRVIQNSIEEGFPVLIENIGERIDSILNPVLTQSFVQKGKKKYIQMGDKELEWNPNFRLYLQTKFSNPRYSPAQLSQISLLNFLVTEKGLEEQLLAVVVNREKPDLEEERVQLLRKENEYKIKLKQCEDNLLYELTNSEGDPLENKTLIENLENTKKMSDEIKIAVEETKITSEKIDESRQVYRPVAAVGSMLYFLIDKLSTIDHMYQYSLAAFMVMFNKALTKAQPDENTQQRVKNISDATVDTLFNYVSRGLFQKHKLIFSTMLCLAMNKEEISPKQLQFLLKGTKIRGVPCPENVQSFVSEEVWASIQGLAEHVDGTSPPFRSLPSDMNGSYRRWKEWCEYEKPEEKPLPLEWKTLKDFEKLLVIRCLRPDRLTMSLTKYISDKIGEKYVQDIPSDLKTSFEDAGPTTPIFFILSPGVDPVKSVEQMGEDLGFTGAKGNFKNVSLGEGQEPVAEEALEVAFRNGGWVILNNLHLTPNWLPILEKKLDDFDACYAREKMLEMNEKLKKQISNLDEKTVTAGKDGSEDNKTEETKETTEQIKPDEGETKETEEPKETTENVRPASQPRDDRSGHPDFRVFLSAEPSEGIPIGLLQRSIKITAAAPRGLKSNLQRALMQFSEKTWEGSSKQSEFKSILFALCFFHAVIVERKKFGPQGWNRNYPFNLGDLTTCVNVLHNYLEERPKVPWDDLIYVFGEIMYGGHITDDIDRRLCMTYLRTYIKPELIEMIDLFPGFQSPPPSLNYQGYLEFVNETLPSESPTAFGLHPNAEIGFRSNQGEYLLRTVLEMQPKSLEIGEEIDQDQLLINSISSMMENLPENYNMDDIAEKLGDDRSPFQNSFYQECEYMNELLHEIDRSLSELLRGLNGELSMTDSMLQLSQAIQLNLVPEQWKMVSYPSLRKLDSWMKDLLRRCHQLTTWTDDLGLPKVTWIGGFFNPQSFLTAILQSTARKMSWPLDKMSLIAEITKKPTEEGIDQPARDGAYIRGLYLEGATWDIKTNSLVESKLKDLRNPLPVVHIKAVQVDKLNPDTHYECPVYKTGERGPTFVFMIKLKTKDQEPAHWIRRGVGILLEGKFI